MRITITEGDILPESPSIGDRKQSELMPTTTTIHRSRTNSNHSERDSVLSDCTYLPSSSSSSSTTSCLPSPNVSSDDEIDYLNEFICPTDSEDESSDFSNETNDDYYVEQHLSRAQCNSVNDLQNNGYKRSKRSNKKLNAQRQIKSKQAKSIQINSHNKHLYIHHRLAKRVLLDEPRCHYIPSPAPVPSYSFEELRNIHNQYRGMYRPSYYSNSTKTNRQRQYSHENYNNESQMNLAIYQDYTLNEFNIPDESVYDDTMLNFILEMQNRDLSPEDYEMLLRLDERVERKTVNANILDTLPTIEVDQTHVDDQCTICMEKYNLGQQLKLLPCAHIFHSNCIETYLKEFSIQCPLDNLPLV